ncbi:hypothetical protein [Bordetella sp. LUAb4]|nr:hypothetical protein [Bordetella sp. LUAb4]
MTRAAKLALCPQDNPQALPAATRGGDAGMRDLLGMRLAQPGEFLLFDP